jgi:hypothetical protein
VYQAVVMSAELHEVLEAGFAAVSPVFDVMPIDKSRMRAAREPASLVPEA